VGWMQSAVGLLVAIVPVLGLVGCGGDGEQDGAARGNAPERAFLEAMVPHHRSAVEMATLAERRGEHAEVKELSRAIVANQNDEIARMTRIHMRLFGSKLRPNPEGHARLGLSAEEAGMAHMDAAEELRRANPFDRAFIDEMVPHHQGAIRMARAVLKKTRDRELRRLAQEIVGAQAREIDDMNRWRTMWFGTPSPAGGRPPERQMHGQPGHEG
jgi:uncharacterized protein (DUF305 family)